VSVSIPSAGAVLNMYTADLVRPSLGISLAAAVVALFFYLTALYLYRIFLHPLAGYPGPKLAAASNWYEFYYDVVRRGDFTRHIQELHRKYGV
jgi:hypothetical protein